MNCLVPLAAFAALVALPAYAALRSAAWGTDPAAPLYVGQAYDLTLTLVTDANEEIPSFTIDQGPGRNPDSQTHSEANGQRRTVFRWHQTEDAPRLASIPLTRVVADVMAVQQFGFMRTANTTRQGVGAEAFSYEVVALPGEAAGAPIGEFALSLSADAPDFAPGDLRLLTATLTARQGVVPKEAAFTLEPVEGRAWPWRVTERTEKRLVAQAYFLAEGEKPLALRLRPFRAFDLRTRALSEVPCAPLMLFPRDVSAAPEAARGPEPLRLAPNVDAPALGVVGKTPPEPTGDRVGGWVRVRSEGREGWIPEAALKGGKQ